MAVIGEIAVNIVARTGQFTKGLAAVRKNLSNTGKHLAAFGGVVTGGLLAAAKSFSDFGDHIAKMAKRTGAAVESLSALEFAAGMSGSSLETVEKGMRGMARSILDAQRGSAEIVYAFNALGLSVSSLVGMAPEQQFMALATSLASIKDPTEKAGLAMKLLGRSGTELLPLFNEGKEGIAALVQEAKDLGIVLSAEDAKAAEELNDAFGRLGFQFKAMVKEFAVAISGPLLDFLDRAKEIGRATIDWIGNNQSLVVTIGYIGVAATIAGGTLIGLSALIAKLTFVVKGLAAAVVFLSSHPMVALVTILGAAVVVILKVTGALDKLWNWFSDSTEAAAGTSSEVSKLAKELQKIPAAVQAIPDMEEKLSPGDQLAKLRKQFSEASELLDRMQFHTRTAPFVPQDFLIAIEKQESHLAKLRGEIDRLKAPEDAERLARAEHNVRGQKLFSPGFGALQEGLRGFNDRIFGDDLKQGIIGNLGDVAKQFGTSLAQAVPRGMFEQAEEKGVLDKLPQVFQDVFRQMPQEVAKAANTITLRGSQRHFELEAGRQNKPLNKVEKNTLDTVKAVKAVETAITNLGSVFGNESTFAIP